jgi:hypothetical protein
MVILDATLPTIRVADPADPSKFLTINRSDYLAAPERFVKWVERGAEAVIEKVEGKKPVAPAPKVKNNIGSYTGDPIPLPPAHAPSPVPAKNPQMPISPARGPSPVPAKNLQEPVSATPAPSPEPAKNPQTPMYTAPAPFPAPAKNPQMPVSPAHGPSPAPAKNPQTPMSAPPGPSPVPAPAEAVANKSGVAGTADTPPKP